MGLWLVGEREKTVSLSTRNYLSHGSWTPPALCFSGLADAAVPIYLIPLIICRYEVQVIFQFTAFEAQWVVVHSSVIRENTSIVIPHWKTSIL